MYQRALKLNSFKRTLSYYMIYYQVCDSINNIWYHTVCDIRYVCKIDRFEPYSSPPKSQVRRFRTHAIASIEILGFRVKFYVQDAFRRNYAIFDSKVYSWELSLRVTNTNVRGFSKSRVLLIQNPYSYKKTLHKNKIL